MGIARERESLPITSSGDVRTDGGSESGLKNTVEISVDEVLNSGENLIDGSKFTVEQLEQLGTRLR